MNDDQPTDSDVAGTSRPLDYVSPGAQRGSQWITDDQPGGRWLVVCLMLLGVVAALGAAVAGIAWIVMTWFGGF